MKFGVLPFKCTVAVILWTAVFLITPASGVLNNFGFAALFRIRAMLTKPELDPRIKIFSFDDRTVARLKAFDLSLDDWSIALKAIDANKPKIIMIDKIFDNPSYDDAAVTRFAEAVSALDAPVVPIVFGSPRPIAFREELPSSAVRTGVPSTPAPSWVAQRFVYGPEAALAGGFKKLGHAVYDPTGFLPAMIAGRDLLVPHWSFALREDLRVADDAIHLGDSRVPHTRDGKILVDIQHEETYRNRTFAMVTVIEKAKSGQNISIVKPGDIVVILPAMYTGNTDWRETPVGPMQGGFIMTAMAQSVLSGRFLKVFEWTGALIVLAGFVPLLFYRFDLRRIFLSGAIITTASVVAVFAVFVFFGIAVYWIYPVSATVTSFVFVFYHRSAQVSREKLRMAQELQTAQLVQTSFFSQPSSNLLSIRHFQKPASECGGDWWGHFRAPSGHEYLLVSDATGHGASAALVTAMTFATFTNFQKLMEKSPDDLWSPEDICRHLNKVLCEARRGRASMTCFVACFSPDGKTMSYCNGAHVRPLLVKAAGQPAVSVVGYGGDPIGILDQPRLTPRSLELEKGDRLVFFSDGIYENYPAFKMKSLRKTVEKHAAESSSALLDAVSVAYLKAGVGQVQEDDVTLLVVECLR